MILLVLLQLMRHGGVERFQVDCDVGVLFHLLSLLLVRLGTYEALVKGKQSLVDLKDVIVSMLHEILHDDVKLV